MNNNDSSVRPQTGVHTNMHRIWCIANNVSHIMYRKLCIAVRITTSVSHIMYRILLYRISCIAFHVSHILYRITYMQSQGRPRGTGGHERPREATASHGRPRAPHRPPQNIIPTKMGRPGSPERSVKKKTGDGGPWGATGGHGGPRRGAKKVPAH